MKWINRHTKPATHELVGDDGLTIATISYTYAFGSYRLGFLTGKLAGGARYGLPSVSAAKRMAAELLKEVK